MKQSHFTILALLLIGTAFTLVAFFYNSQQGDQATQQAAQNSEALIRSHSVREGNPQAKVTLVEFFDPACETCAKFQPFVREQLAQYGGKLNLVLRYAPLHPGSEQMVAILEAARMQGQFWPVLELMFATQAQWAINHEAHPEIFWNHMTQTLANVDYERMQRDMNSPELVKAIEQDVADGQALGANMTPAFFVNGKPLTDFGYEQLANLIRTEIAASY